MPTGDTTSTLFLFPPYHHSTYHVSITDANGCTGSDETELKLKFCLHDTIVHTDDSNDMHVPEDPDSPDGNFAEGQLSGRSYTLLGTEELRILPVPAHDDIRAIWMPEAAEAKALILVAPDGRMVQKWLISTDDATAHSKQLQIGGLQNGVYTLVLYTRTGASFARLVKM
jgi:hypothetical protein